MKNEKFLYCYTMTHDTGFAPNPIGVLTLATCKPTIRRCAEKGTWISGWAGVKVYTSKDKKNYVTGKAQQLIYLARITDKLSFAEYWKNEKFEYKKPEDSNDCGDNIYEPIEGKENEFNDPLPNGGGHGLNEKSHDLSGRYVLICDEFYYFGVENPLDVKPIIKDKNFVVPRCKKLLINSETAISIKEYVKNNYSLAKYYSLNTKL